MKRTIRFLAVLGLASTLGCGTTRQMTAEKHAADKYAADQPLETAPKRPGRVELNDPAPPKAVSRIDPEAIDEDNVNDYVRRLQRDLQTDGSAMNKAGK